MLSRPALEAALKAALGRAPVVALLGPRQCGKTTLARQLVPPTSANYFDLEDPISLARLEEPLTALGELRGTVVIDEVQRRPELFPLLRVLADRAQAPARFLILGSASPALLRQSSESLAGRLEIVEMAGFDLAEVGLAAAEELWLRGGFPRAFLAANEGDSLIWRRDFIRTLLESDLPQLGVRVPAATLQRFWAMLAHFHGQPWNGAELGRSLGVSQTSCRRYLELLEGIFMVRLLPPWHANLLKRQVKAPKIYIRDSGLLHQLLQISDRDGLLCHPRLGASWEGFVIEQLLAAWQADGAWFWATHGGAELDLLVQRGGRRIGVEIKRADAPRLSASMRQALADLELDQLIVVSPGDRSYRLTDRATVMPLAEALAVRF
ncbi:MAG: ATP-binding protein [Cyanobacteriota bacterium]|jgi:predicted AAA+ superfamily ATPase